MLQTLSRDVRSALRTLARAPGFTTVAVLTLALGIGAATAIFSAVNGVLLEPLPYPRADRIVGLWHGAPKLGYSQFGISPGFFYLYQTQSQAYQAMGLYASSERNLTGHGDAERVPVVVSTPGLFDVLAVRPLLGRTFTEADAVASGPGVVVLGYGLWQRRFGGDRSALGRTMQVNGSPTQIIGIMPRGFDFGGPNRRAELWIPLRMDLAHGDPGLFAYSGVARLEDGVTPEAALAQETALVQRARTLWAGEASFIGFLNSGGFHPIVHSLQEDVVGEMRNPLWILLGTVVFVLLIACGNVANLFLVRAEGRQRETAVRSALGASRARLATGFLLESVLLAGLGGALGLALASGGTSLLLRMAPPELPRVDQISTDGTVLMFTLATTLLSALLTGLAPALRLDSSGLLARLRHAGRGATESRERYRVRNVLVVGQTALAAVLLVGSGLMVRSFREIRRIDPGFDTGGVLTFRLTLPGGRYGGATKAAAFHQQLLERLRALPGVAAAGGVSEFPLVKNAAGTEYRIEDRPTTPGELAPMFWYKYVTPGYFEAMGITVVAGRGFERGDHEQAFGNIVVSRALADRVWPGQNVLGKRLSPSPNPTALDWERIVGVVENTRDHGLRQDPLEMVYHPLVGPHQNDGYSVPDLTYAIRTSDPTDVVGAVRAQVKAADPDLPLARLQTLDEIVAASIIRLTFTALTLGIAALMALTLGTVGLYGVLSYVVTQRSREIGLRMALGAQTGQVVRMVVASGTKLAGAGLVAGVLGAVALTRLLRTFLFRTQPLDPVTFAGMSLLFVAVGLLAIWIPARRAARVNPVQAMRFE